MMLNQTGRIWNMVNDSIKNLRCFHTGRTVHRATHWSIMTKEITHDTGKRRQKRTAFRR
jgi:hypothetical protein